MKLPPDLMLLYFHSEKVIWTAAVMLKPLLSKTVLYFGVVWASVAVSGGVMEVSMLAVWSRESIVIVLFPQSLSISHSATTR